MSSKLCPHSLRPTPDSLEMVRAGSPLVKLVNDFGSASEYLSINPNLVIVGRQYTPLTLLEQLNSGDNAESAAAKFVEMQRGKYELNPLVKIWEGHNEPSFGGPNDPGALDNIGWYARFEAERLRLLSRLGLRGVVGNFSVGYPEINFNDLRMWTAFLPAVQAAKTHNGLLGLHEYAAPWMWWWTGSYQAGNCDHPERWGFPGGFDSGWLTLRYRQIYRYVLSPQGLGDVPLVITECGNDTAGGGCPGMPAGAWKDMVSYWNSWDGYSDPIDYWRGSERDPERYYAEQLKWYDKELQKDPYVVGATIFTVGTDNPIWDHHDISGTRVSRYLVEHIRASHGSIPPVIETPPVVVEPEDPISMGINLIRNGSFEEGWAEDTPAGTGNQTPKGWTLTFVPKGQAMSF